MAVKYAKSWARGRAEKCPGPVPNLFPQLRDRYISLFVTLLDFMPKWHAAKIEKGPRRAEPFEEFSRRRKLSFRFHVIIICIISYAGMFDFFFWRVCNSFLIWYYFFFIMKFMKLMKFIIYFNEINRFFYNLQFFFIIKKPPFHIKIFPIYTFSRFIYYIIHMRCIDARGPHPLPSFINRPWSIQFRENSISKSTPPLHTSEIPRWGEDEA